MNWLTDFVKPKLSSLVTRKSSPSDLWTNCNKCNLMLYKSEHKNNLFVCSHCDNHMNMDVENRLNNLFDEKTYKLINIPFENNDPLKFKDLKKYSDRIKAAQKKTTNSSSSKKILFKIDWPDTVVHTVKDIYILISSIYPYSNRTKKKQVNIYNSVGRGAKTKYIIPRKII